MKQYVVKLDNSRTPKYFTTREKLFSSENEARQYAYHLKVSNFDNPYELPVQFEVKINE